MRVFVLALLLAACGSDDDPGPVDPHTLGGCDTIWNNNGYTECEAACRDSVTALNAQGNGCQATTASGPLSCQKTFVFSGVTGCCASNQPQVLFGECD